MVRCFAAECSSLPSVPSLFDTLPASWVTAWRERHGEMRDEGEQQKSLGGLYLLFANGGRGILRYTSDGRPYFEDAVSEFSITHTDSFVFCAIGEASDGAVGIDAESLSRVPSHRVSAIASRWFSPLEQALYEMDPTTETFLRLWTRKEAYVKYTGEGLRALQGADTVALESAELQFRSVMLGETCITVCTKKGKDPFFNFNKGE